MLGILFGHFACHVHCLHTTCARTYVPTTSISRCPLHTSLSLTSPHQCFSRCLKQYAAREFGTCPLIQCNGQPALPVGLRDEMGADTVKIYCPRCQSVYHPPPARSRPSHHGPGPGSGSGAVDGAAFGTTFPHLFLMTFNNLVPKPLNSKSKYVPRVFGFRVHDSARQRPPTTGTGNAGRRHGGGNGHAASASRSGAGRAVEAAAVAAVAARTRDRRRHLRRPVLRPSQPTVGWASRMEREEPGSPVQDEVDCPPGRQEDHGAGPVAVPREQVPRGVA